MKITPLRALVIALGAGSAAMFCALLFFGNDIDGVAFYCGARTILSGGNPYLNEPLHACETHNAPALFAALGTATTVPSPLPPYALDILTPLALLPGRIALDVWRILLVAALVATVFAVRRLTRLPLIVASSIMLFVPYYTVPGGSFAPIPLALLAWTAVLCEDRRWNAAAVCASFSMLEPNIGLPVCLTLFFWLRPLRVRLLAIGTGLATTSIALPSGAELWRVYLWNVLPAQAAVELANRGQYALAPTLHQLGVYGQLASRIGVFQSVVLLACGVIAGGLIACWRREPAWLIYIPATFAVIGGTYVHLAQIAVAIPLAALLWTRLGWRPGYFAMLLLAVPWEIMLANGATSWLIPLALVILVLMRMETTYPIRTIYVVTLAVLVATFGASGISLHYHQHLTVTGAIVGNSRIAPSALAETAWEGFSRSMDGLGPISHIPSWAGLIILLYGVSIASLATRRRPPVVLSG